MTGPFHAAPGAGLPDDVAAREAQHQVLATLLGAYVDGELPPETSSQIDAHLLGCGRCRSELAVQRAVGNRLARSTVPTATAAFQSRIRAALADVPVVQPDVSGASTWTRRRLVVPALISLLAVVTIAVVLAGRGIPERASRHEPAATGRRRCGDRAQ